MPAARGCTDAVLVWLCLAGSGLVFETRTSRQQQLEPRASVPVVHWAYLPAAR